MFYFGFVLKVIEVLNGMWSLSFNMICKLSIGLGIFVDVLIKEFCYKSIIFKDINWDVFFIFEMWVCGYFEGFKGLISELKEYLIE